MSWRHPSIKGMLTKSLCAAKPGLGGATWDTPLAALLHGYSSGSCQWYRNGWEWQWLGCWSLWERRGVTVTAKSQVQGGHSCLAQSRGPMEADPAHNGYPSQMMISLRRVSSCEQCSAYPEIQCGLLPGSRSTLNVSNSCIGTMHPRRHLAL
jgi:hypothetical protein